MRRTTLMMASHQARDAPQVDITNIYGSYGILIHNKAKQSSERAVLIFPPEGDVLFVKNSRIYDSVPTDAFLLLTIAEKPDVQIMSTDMTTVLRVYSLSIGLDALATHDGTDSRHVLVGSEYEARAIGEIINHLIAKQRISDIIQAQPIEFSGLIELGVDGVWEPKWTIVAGDKLMLFDEKRSTRPNSVISLAGIESIQRLGENRTIVPDRLTAEARRTFGQSNRPRVKRIIVDDPAQSGLSLTLRQIEELEGGYEEVELPVLEDSSEKYPIMSCIRHSVDVDIFQFINDDVCTAWLDAISAAKDAVTAHFNEIVRLELEEEKERIRATNQERLDAIQREKEGPEPIPLPEDLQHIYLSDCTSKVPLIDHPTSVIIVQDAYSPISTFDGQIQPTVPSSLAGKLIRFVAQGAGHHVAINSKNQLYSWGVGSENQLGLGPSKTEQSIPMLMTSLIKERIISVACGTHHTLALSDSGSLFAWGKNTNGQLGVDIEEANSGYPRQVDIPPIRYIAAGGNTSFALSQDGHLYTWGSNSNSVMAIPTAETRVNIKKPTLHPTLNGPIRQISISPDGSSGIAIVEPYSVASLKSKYDVWTWGSNVQGQLGLGPGAEAFRAKITPVKQLHRFGVNVVQVAMGIGCAACITDTGDLYTWGRAGSSGHTVPTDFPTLIPHLNNIQSITVTSSGFIVTDSNYKPHVLGLGASCITPLGISPQYQVLSASSSPVSGETVFIVEGALVGNTSVQSTAVAPQAALDPRQVQNFAPRQKNQGGALPSQSLPPPSFGNPQSFSASSASQHDSLNDRVKMTRGKLQGGALPRLAPPPPPPPGMGGMDLGGFNIGGIEMPTALADDMYRSDRNVNVLMSNARNRQGRGREVDSQKLEHDVLAAASLMLNMHLVAGGTDREGKDIDKEAFQKALNKSTAPPPPPEPMPAPAPMQMTQQSVNLPPPPPPSDDMDLPPPPPPSFSINNQAQFQDLPPPPPPGSDFSALPPPPGPSDFDLPPMPATTTTTKAPVKKSGFVNKHFATKAPVAASSVPVFDMDMDFPPPPM